MVTGVTTVLTTAARILWFAVGVTVMWWASTWARKAAQSQLGHRNFVWLPSGIVMVIETCRLASPTEIAGHLNWSIGRIGKKMMLARVTCRIKCRKCPPKVYFRIYHKHHTTKLESARCICRPTLTTSFYGNEFILQCVLEFRIATFSRLEGVACSLHN